LLRVSKALPEGALIMELTGRQFLTRVMQREAVDRVPIAPFLYYNAVYEMFGYEPRIDGFFDPDDFDPVEKYVEYCGRFGFDILHTLGSAKDPYRLIRPGPDWDVRIDDVGDENSRRQTISIRTPGGNLRQTENVKRSSRHLIVSAIDEYLIKSKEDFELVRKYAPPADDLDCSLVVRARRAVGDRGLVAPCTHGVFNTLNMFRKLDNVMMDPLVDEGWYREMAEYFLEFLIVQARQLVAAGVDVIEIGGNLATSQVGPKFFERYVLDYEKRLIAAIHELGPWTIYHNCGDAAKIMHLYNQLETDVWGYLTPPPFGDVNLDEALRVIRPDMILRGNIDQVDFMVKASASEVRERVRGVLEKVKPRGNFILSTTDFFFDGTPYANIDAFTAAGREFGVY
jgi:uroporphyrinogen decarboxylase